MKGYTDKIIKILDPKDLYKLNCRQPFSFTCKKCGKAHIIHSGWKTESRRKLYSRLLCNRCALIDSTDYDKANNSRYKTFMDKYGVPNVGSSHKFQTRAQNSKESKYGNRYFNNHEKASKTYKEKTGYSTPLENPEARAIGIESNLKNLGVKYPAQNPSIIKKMSDTYKRNTGYNNPMRNPEIMDEFKNNNLCLYGVENWFQSEEFEIMRDNHPEWYKFNRKFHKYKYNDVDFDSGWELALWIYAKDHNEDIVREPCFFEFEYGGKSDNKYYPDFLYKGKLIEIKGDHFFEDYNRSKRMICPYSRYSRNTRYFTPEEKKWIDDLYEAKHQCGLRNGVEFWGKEDMKPYMNYIDEKYGLKYLASFKIK